METEIEDLEDDEVVGTEDQRPDGDLVKKLRKQLDQANKAKKDAQTELEKSKKESAITGSELKLTEKQRIALEAAHGDKEFSAEALRETAAELGFIKDAGVNATPEEVEAHKRISEASSGATTTSDPNVDFDAKLQEFIRNNDQAGMEQYLLDSGWLDGTTNRWKRDS